MAKEAHENWFDQYSNRDMVAALSNSFACPALAKSNEEMGTGGEKSKL
jgi:hypothetical protein